MNGQLWTSLPKRLRGWASRQGARWIVQQSSQAATACLLPLSAVTTGALSDVLFTALIVTVTADSACLWTGTADEGRQARRALHTSMRGYELAHHVSLPNTTAILGQHAYHRARYRGYLTSQLWFAIQMFLVVPLAFYPATVAWFLPALLAREATSRLGPFTVPTAESRRNANLRAAGPARVPDPGDVSSISSPM